VFEFAWPPVPPPLGLLGLLGLLEPLALLLLPLAKASSLKMSRDQSKAPFNNQDACTLCRSALSTSTCFHCCHKATLANVATNVTTSMALIKAAPR
jgi:hypothetical protein